MLHGAEGKVANINIIAEYFEYFCRRTRSPTVVSVTEAAVAECVPPTTTTATLSATTSTAATTTPAVVAATTTASTGTRPCSAATRTTGSWPSQLVRQSTT